MRKDSRGIAFFMIKKSNDGLKTYYLSDYSKSKSKISDFVNCIAPIGTNFETYLMVLLFEFLMFKLYASETLKIMTKLS